MNEKNRILFFRYSMYPGAGLGIDNQWSTIVPLQLVMNLGDVINLDVNTFSVTVSSQGNGLSFNLRNEWEAIGIRLLNEMS